ncbi:tipE homolog 4 phospholipid transfer protein isoform X1 [Halictus rubicundus]|uniref:tipE homolog 4 phospholipid transfer protein isoform X1 n=1 Tax=Halictus rubicundus TaxID=77578 RepID=UPI004036314F
MGRKHKRRLIPEQDRRICGSICLCQFTIVISCVALVYLSVAIYMPSHRAFHAGIEPDPVMCQTIDTTLANNCGWASCGEWCLTRTTGFCPQIRATVRRNGTDIVFQNCTKFNSISCPKVNMAAVKRYNCNNGSECSVLSGVFNCSLGHCANLSELMLCHHKADGIVVDSEKDNMKLNGFFSCQSSRCTKIKNPFTCDRYCPKISTSEVNVFLMQDDNVITARCEHGLALNMANGNLPGTRLTTPAKIWDSKNSSIFASCMAVSRERGTVRAEDCVNGTLLKEIPVPEPHINFTSFLNIYEKSLQYPFDTTNVYMPAQRSLTIYNSSRLYINLEGCVNTLKGECKDFLTSHGRDGDNQTAQSRYPCYYNKNNSYFVVARFDLNKTRTELLIAVIVPSGLFVMSLTTLVIITRSVQVGDDAKMRCRYCVDKQQVEGEDEGLVEATPSSSQGHMNENEIKSMEL